MNLVRKLEIARQAIASITRHDDASEKEHAAACEAVAVFLKTERAEAASRRAARDAARVAAIEAQGGQG